MDDLRIGIDIGGMSIKIGIVDEEYHIIDKRVIATDSDIRTQEETAEAMVEVVCRLAEDNRIQMSECDCVGIACPGTVDAGRGTVLYSNNLRWENLALLEGMRKYIPAPMGLANDADAAALGEVLAGAAKGKKSAILLTLGTGVGGGVILDGEIFCGCQRGGCEPGHMVIKQGGRLCTCGRKGCFEQYASALALMDAGRRAALKNSDSLLVQLCGGSLSEIRGDHIFEAAGRGDSAAQRVVEEYEEDLSIGIANLVNIFRPEIVILGGGVSAQGENLTRQLQDRVGRMCFGGEHGEVPPIVTSVLGNDAGIIGAAYLC